jgi:hypothetical protein
MRQVLWDYLEQNLGWRELFEQHVPLPQANTLNECGFRAPFADMEDRDPSCSLNVVKGLWNCFSRPERKGDYIHFLCWIDGEIDEATNELVPLDYDDVEHELLQKYGLVATVTNEQCKDWRDNLSRVFDDLWNAGVMRTKSWSKQACWDCEVGWDGEWFTLPVANGRKKLANTKLYKPGGIPKSKWRVEGINGNWLFPRIAWNDQRLILVEGEPDAITLRSLHFNGCSGTHGSSKPVPDGRWYIGKTVYVLMDADRAGREATKRAADILRGGAREVIVCELPQWEGMGDHADVSDYVWHLRANLGWSDEQVAEAIKAILNSGEQVELKDPILDRDPIDIPFGELLNTKHGRAPLRVRTRVITQTNQNYKVPRVVEVRCTPGGHAYCAQCPMSARSGLITLEVDLRTRSALKLINVSDTQQMPTYKELIGIPSQCPEPKAEVITYANARPTAVMTCLSDNSGNSLQTALTPDNYRCETLFVSPDVDRLRPNTDYELVGFNYADPKTQRAIFWSHKAEPVVPPMELFELTSELGDKLKIFQPDYAAPNGVWNKLVDVAEDLSSSVTLIRGRADLHLAYRTVWHSCLAFTFRGAIYKRGWIEAIVIGDTRCGKSAAFQAMAEMYDLGVMVDCKNQTAAGILGTAVQSVINGDWLVVPGVYPQNDGRMVCFDEFHYNRDQPIVSLLSSTRSSGVANIAKAGSASFPARVRSIWLANPAQGKLLKDLGGYGVEYLKRLIPQPEDIARFDYAMAVAEDEVPLSSINDQQPPTKPRYEDELHRALLAWTYSRKPEQIVFNEDAEQSVLNAATIMSEAYSSSISLVAPADQRNKIAKIAVSIAAQCFSCSEDGHSLVVRREHVQAAVQLLYTWYNKASFGYDRFSDQDLLGSRIINEDELIALFNNQLGVSAEMFTESLLKADTMSWQSIIQLSGSASMIGDMAASILMKCRAIQLTGGRHGDRYEKTPAFVAWLRQWQAARKRSA